MKPKMKKIPLINPEIIKPHGKNYSREGNRPHQQQQHGPMMFGVPGEKPKNFRQTTKRLLNYLKPYMASMIIMTIFSILATIIIVFTPLLSQYILNTMQKVMTGSEPSSALDLIPQVFLLLILAYIVRFIFDLVSQLIGNKLSATVGKNMRNDLRNKLEKCPIKFFDETKTGNTLSTFSNDVETITDSLQQSIVSILSGLLMLIGSLGMMFYISWELTIIALITLPLYILATTMITKRSQPKFVKQQAELANLNGFIEEMFSSHKVVKLFSKEQTSYEEFQVINENLTEVSQGAQFISGLIRPMMDLISNLGYVLVVIVGGILAGATNPLLIGDISTFITLQKRFVNPILTIANMANTLQSTLAASERVFKLLDVEEEIEEQNVDQFDYEHFKGNVELKNVDFSYRKDQDLIKNLNLKVEAGKQIAIVGPTGAGKTTLVNLLMRFYETDAGEIIIDGIKSTDVPRKTLRSIFGMVLQDTWLFSGTIRDNIAYGKDDATIEEVKEVCRQAHVDHFIETMPEGYNTVLKEDAANISQGQKQLLTIARAILFNPKILILDEATSSVDTRTEAYIQNAMNFMMEDRTSFVIAHRLSTIKKASVILVMNNGTIVEQGTHKELLEKNGAYAELYNSQFVNAMI
ncbi:MAG: ABC transporter ATP-binding protein [Candidatus Izemoplasmatales bacterium]|nr:ABC transporter ATP-binding protein [Candidatus Izemoplasmatales bacterium]MDD4595370.1 ABC transporter ATP-binding protein [Candidatus Izemoplasmatales bacterium]